MTVFSANFLPRLPPGSFCFFLASLHHLIQNEDTLYSNFHSELSADNNYFTAVAS